MLNSGDVFAGFTIERLLGQGGMGSVYLARHPRLGRLTALKLLNRELFADREIRARFEREADLVAQLDHPNIVEVYDRGSENEQLWISMQYVDGVDAASVNVTQLPPERAVQIIEGVAAALDYANSMGVLHRDVKPANIILARAVAGHGERVFLSDFGIARLREDSTHLTQAGMFTATLAYASPEQMTGAPLDHATDQYSLACALYWLLIGMGPYDSPHPTELIRGHLQLLPPPVSLRRPGLTTAMDAVLTRAMAKRPTDRFPTSTDFAKAARRALAAPGTPVPPYLGPVYAPAPPAYPAQPPAYAPYPPPYNYPAPPNPQSPQAYPPPPAYPALVPAPNPAQPALPPGPAAYAPSPQPAGQPPQPAGQVPYPAGQPPQPAGPAPQPAGYAEQPAAHAPHPGAPAGPRAPQPNSDDQRTDLLARPDAHTPPRHPAEAGYSPAAGQVTDAILYADSPPPLDRAADPASQSDPAARHDPAAESAPSSATLRPIDSDSPGAEPQAAGDHAAGAESAPDTRMPGREGEKRSAGGGTGASSGSAAPGSGVAGAELPERGSAAARSAGVSNADLVAGAVTADADPDVLPGSKDADAQRGSAAHSDRDGGSADRSEAVHSGRTPRPEQSLYPDVALRNPSSGAFVPSAGVGAAAGRFDRERARALDSDADSAREDGESSSSETASGGSVSEHVADHSEAEPDSADLLSDAGAGTAAGVPETAEADSGPVLRESDSPHGEIASTPADFVPGAAEFGTADPQHAPPGAPPPEYGSHPPGGAYGSPQPGHFTPNGAPPQADAGWRTEVDRAQVNALVVSGLAVLVLALMLLILAVMVLG
ncbi:protein kinase domain-containing protein [Nocardia sp. NPDC055321]